MAKYIYIYLTVECFYQLIAFLYIVELLLFTEVRDDGLVVTSSALHVPHLLALPVPVHLLVGEHVVDVGVKPAGPRHPGPSYSGPGVTKVKRPHLFSNGRLW